MLHKYSLSPQELFMGFSTRMLKWVAIPFSVDHGLSQLCLMLSHCSVGEDSWKSLGLQGDQINPKGNQLWIFIGRADVEAEAPILWPPDGKSWLIGKDSDTGKNRRQEEKGTPEDEMVGWHHWLHRYEFEQTPGDGETGKPGMLQSMQSQTDMTEWLNNNNLKSSSIPNTVVVVQSPSHVRFLTTPWTVPHHLLEFAQVHVHFIGDAIQPSHPLLPSSATALNLSQHQGIFQWVVCLHQSISLLLSCDRLFVTPWTAGFPALHQLLELAQTFVHWISHAIQPSQPLSSPSPTAFNLSLQQGIFQWVLSAHKVAKVLEFQLQHQFFQWTSMTDFLLDWLIWSPCSPRDSQESSPTPQFKSSNSSVLSFLYSPTLTSIHDYQKHRSFD